MGQVSASQDQLSISPGSLELEDPVSELEDSLRFLFFCFLFAFLAFPEQGKIFKQITNIYLLPYFWVHNYMQKYSAA